MLQELVRVYDDVLDPRTLATLQQAIRTVRLKPTVWWDGGPPQNIVELVIHALRRSLGLAGSTVGAEWWVRRESVAGTKDFHFDADEALSARGTYVHPRLATVFYLTETGGPTLVVDQRCTPDGQHRIPEDARERLVVEPRTNRYLVFDGSLLHAVLRPRTAPGQRVTFLINWWHRRILDADNRQYSNDDLGLTLETAMLAAPSLRLAPNAARPCVVRERGDVVTEVSV